MTGDQNQRTLLRHPSHAELYAWFRRSPIHNWIAPPCSDDLSKLCVLVDQLPSSNPPRIGLELHHWPTPRTDASFFGDSTLLTIPGVSYPDFALQWRDQVNAKHPNHPFSNELVVEFDHTPTGYKLMGLFQHCQTNAKSIKPILSLIDFYADSRQRELNKISNSNMRSQSTRRLQQNFDAIGPPTCLGFVDREAAVVKIITQIETRNQNATIDYLENAFCGDNNGGPAPIADCLRDADLSCSARQQARLSLDYDISNGRFLERYALEFYDHPDLPAKGSRRGTIEQTQAFRALQGRGDFARSEHASTRLPYAEKRPHANLLSQDIMLVMHSHKKLTTCQTNTSIKDYAILVAWSQPQA